MAVGKSMPVNETFWLDSKVKSLKWWERYLFLYLITNSHIEQAGIYEITYKTISYETDLELYKIDLGIEKLSELNMVAYDKNTQEIAILNYLKYSILKGGKPTEKCFENLAKKIKSITLMQKMYDNAIKNIDERDIYTFALDKYRNAIELKKALIIETKSKENIPIEKEFNPWEQGIGEELVVIEEDNNDNSSWPGYYGVWVKRNEIDNIKYEKKEFCFEMDGESRIYKTFKPNQLENISYRIYIWQS